MRAKAVGERGSWFATVNGERLPCVYSQWLIDKAFLDPGYVEGDGKWRNFVAAVRDKQKVILTKGEPFAAETKSGVAFKRTGYIAVFHVQNVKTDEHGLHFLLLGRERDLA